MSTNQTGGEGGGHGWILVVGVVVLAIIVWTAVMAVVRVVIDLALLAVVVLIVAALFAWATRSKR